MGAPGCDDAPLIKPVLGHEATPFTLIVPYYENPQFLEQQIQGWKFLKLKEHIEIILVDDGSPRKPAIEILQEQCAYNIRHFRIGVDVRWNWLAARNIGAHYAKDGWILLTDIDHVLNNKAVSDIVYGVRDENTIYRFSRREHDSTPIHPHPNSWLMTRKMFWKIGGYDEACSGYYGTDGDYRRRCARAAPIRILTTELIRYEYIKDSSTTHYKRKQPEDAAVKRIIKARKLGWKPRIFSFPYHEVIV